MLGYMSGSVLYSKKISEDLQILQSYLEDWILQTLRSLLLNDENMDMDHEGTRGTVL